MKSTVALLVSIVVGLVIFAALAPPLIALSHAAVPLIVAVGVAVIAVRLVFFHTRRW